MRRALLLSAALAALGVVLWFLLAPTEPPVPRVAFSELVAGVQRGSVVEVRIKGDVYAFDVRQEGSTRLDRKQATGPAADIAQVRALRPSNPALAAPKVSFVDEAPLVALGERKMRVAFSEFLAMVEEGHVDEIRVSGRVYAFHVDSGATQETFGPAILDPAQVRALRPADPGRAAPTVSVAP